MSVEGRKEKRKMEEIIPQELLKLSNWVGYELRRNKDRLDKVPMNVLTGRPAKTNDPDTWSEFHTAIDLVAQRNYAGIGFVFQPPYVGVDIDHCVKDGAIAPYALEILKSLNSYSEYSPSGTGIHILCKGEIVRACKLSKIGLEIYTKGRFFTVTGNRLEEYPTVIQDRTELLNKLIDKYTPAKSKPHKRVEKNSNSVENLLAVIAKSKDENFQKLFYGDWKGNYGSQSEADLALCGKLAFWTAKDPALMDQIFRQSKLFREKWDRRHYADGRSYGQGVIDEAISGCDEVFTSEKLGKQKIPQGEVITRECEELIEDFFRDQQGNFQVVLPIADHLEVYPTNTTKFRNWIARGYRERHGVPPQSESVRQATIQIEARCESSRQVDLFNRVGIYEGAIYYDLSSPDWNGIKITPHGWQIVRLPPIFRRYVHQNPQAVPIPGDPKDFLNFCNINKDDHCLFLVAAASFFIPNIPHVVISQRGEQGSGKSTNTKNIKRLVDPSKVNLISSPKDLEQAQMIADKQWVNPFDNISKIIEWFSDFLCRGVTGEGDMKRSLYTNDDEYIRSYRRCFVLNGIGNSMWRPDLLDRSIIFDIPLLKDSRPEKQMEQEWKESLPGILGGFFTAISRSMSELDKVIGHEKFRMADFVQWGIVLAEQLGFSSQEFLVKYKESVDHKWEDTAEGSSLVNRLTYLVMSNNGEWAGTAAELLEQIKPEGSTDKTLPNNARWLSTELMRIAPVMRNMGIDILRLEKREPGTGRRLFILRKIKRETECEQDREQGVSRCEQEVSDDRLFDERPF